MRRTAWTAWALLAASVAFQPLGAQPAQPQIAPTLVTSDQIEACVEIAYVEGTCVAREVSEFATEKATVRLTNRGSIARYVALVRTDTDTVHALPLKVDATILQLQPGESVTTGSFIPTRGETWEVIVLDSAQASDILPRSASQFPPDWRERRFWLGYAIEPAPAAGGGVPVPFGEADWMVAIYDPRPYSKAEIAADSALPPEKRKFLAEKTPEERAHSCGGAMIDDNVVITAAHCVATGAFEGAGKTKVFKDRRVRLGSLRLGKGGETRAIAGMVVHADYNGKATGQPNDIALLLLKRDDRVHYRPRPLSIARRPIDTQTVLMVLGWGYTKQTRGGLINMMQDGGAQRNAVALQKAPMQPIATADCVRHFGAKIKPGMVCLGTPKARQESGGSPTFSCRGDSGGPLVRNFGNGDDELVGLVSWSVGCGNGKPSVYTDVTHFAPWIAAARQALKPGAAVTVARPAPPPRGPRRR